MENKLRIKISADGLEVVGLYSDDFPWSDIGEIKVSRASDVFFDHSSKRWKIKLLPDGDILPLHFEKRKEAIAFEREFLEARL